METETAYLLRSPASAKRLLAALKRARAGKGREDDPQSNCAKLPASTRAGVETFSWERCALGAEVKAFMCRGGGPPPSSNFGSAQRNASLFK